MMHFDIELSLVIIAAILLLPMLLARGGRRKTSVRRQRDADRSVEAVVRYLRTHFDP